MIYGGGGNDHIIGGTKNDEIHGGEGNDTIFGGDGADTILGGAGTDIIHGGDAMDYLMGDDGNDYISGDAGGQHFSAGNLLHGGSGNDLIFAGDGGDQIEGDGNNHEDNGRNNIGNDHLFGGKGNDELIGGRGNDFLAGGHGDDTYHFSVDDGVNIINEECAGYNTIVFKDYLYEELLITRHGSNLLFTSLNQGDSLRVLIKDQIVGNRSKIKTFSTKSPSGNGKLMHHSMDSRYFIAEHPDQGQITDSTVNDMLNKEREYGINKVSSIFNPEHLKYNSEQNLAMLTQAISQQQESQSTSEFLPPHFIPKNVATFINSLHSQ